MKKILLLLLGAAIITGCEINTTEAGDTIDHSTFVYSITPDDWYEYPDGSGLYYDIDAPEITYDILDYGYFATYENIGSRRDPSYLQLPKTNVYTDENGITYSIEVVPIYTRGNVRIEYFDTHPDVAFRPEQTMDFRTVVISEPYYIETLQDNVDVSDYDELMDFLKKDKSYKSNNTPLE